VTRRAVYVNAIGTATPANEVHGLFASYVPCLIRSDRERRLFDRMVQRCGIEQRYSVLAPGGSGQLDDAGLYRRGAFADTAARMRVYQERARRISPSRPLSISMTSSTASHICCWSRAPALPRLASTSS
jgi:hypothetical protein